MSHESPTNADEGVCTNGTGGGDDGDSDGDGGDDDLARKAELKGGFIKGQWTKVNPIPLHPPAHLARKLSSRTTPTSHECLLLSQPGVIRKWGWKLSACSRHLTRAPPRFPHAAASSQPHTLGRRVYSRFTGTGHPSLHRKQRPGCLLPDL